MQDYSVNEKESGIQELSMNEIEDVNGGVIGVLIWYAAVAAAAMLS